MKLTAATFLNTLLRWRLLIITLWMVTVLTFAVLYLARFHINNSVDIWFLQDDPELQDFRAFNDTFGELEWTYLWLKTESIYDPSFLKTLGEMTDRIEQLDHVQRVISITNVKDNEIDEEGALDYKPIYPGQPGATPESKQVKILKDRLERNPIFAENFFKLGNERHTIIAIQNENLLGELRPYRIEFVDAIRKILTDYPQIRNYGLAGTALINAELNRAAKRDMFVYYALISLLLVVSGYIFLYSWRDLAILLAVTLGVVVPTMGMVTTLGQPFNMITVMLPTLMVTMGVSYVVHFINEFHAGCRTETVQTALEHTLTELWRPGLWTAVTTTIGFLSLAISTVIPISQFGVLAAFGIFLAWLQTMLIVPIFLHYLWSNTPSQPHFHRRFRVVVYNILHIIKHRSAYILAGFLVLALTISGLPKMEANTDYVRFFRESNALRADYQKIEGSEFAQSYVNVVLTFSEDSDYASRENFTAILRFEQAIEALPEVRKINTVTHLLREVDKAFNGADASEMAFREYGANQVSQLLLLAEASGNDDVTELITGERQQVQLVVMTDYMSTKELNLFRQQLETIQAQILPVEIKMLITGTNVLWANMDDQVVQTQLLSLIVTSVVMLILLPIIFRSFLLGLFGFFVSFMPILFTLGLMAWTGITINIATCLIGGVVIGIAVDDTIYFLFRMRGELKKGFSLSYATKRAILITGKGMITTSLILMSGFITMIASDFLPSAYFGLFFAISICIALLADLFLLPVILSWLYGKDLKSLS